MTSLKSRLSLPLTHFADPDGIGSISYSWIRDNETIATGSSYTLTQQDVGFSISLLAAYTDAYGKDTSVTSNSSALIQNVDDPASAQVLIHGNAEEGGSLTAFHNFSDPDGSLANTSFQWQQRIDDRWVPIDGQTSPDLEIPDDQSFVDTNLRAVITTTDALDGSSTFHSDSLTVQNVDDNPTGSVTINGAFLEKQTLTAANNLADQDGIGSISYSWIRNNETIATGSSYTLTQQDVGFSISLQAAYTDAYGKDTSVTSNSSAHPKTLMTTPQGPSPSTVTSLKSRHSLPLTHSLIQTALAPSPTPGSEITKPLLLAPLTLTQQDVGFSISLQAAYTDAWERHIRHQQFLSAHPKR